MNDNHHILPKNFWTEHQYNVGLGNGKEIRCYGHKIADKKTMDDLLRKALQNMQYQATNNMNSPQLADDLKFKSLPESMKSNTPNMDKEVAQQNADKAIERVKNLAEEAKQKTDDLMKKADAGNNVESVWIKMKYSKYALLIGTMYRPPSSNCDYLNEMYDQLDQMNMLHNNIILMGDLNFDFKQDESLSSNPIHHMELLYDMKQLIQEPTRVTANTSTLIGVILSNVYDSHD